MEIVTFQTTLLLIFMTTAYQFAVRSHTQEFRRGVKSEIWQSVLGEHVSNLTCSSVYHTTPTMDDILSPFDARVNIGVNYGQRLTTFYRARETGDHIFYMTCKDECELWLSPDDKPGHKRRIIFVPNGMNLSQADWERNAAQMSSPITMISGEFYFMQALMKAGSNSFDHLGVGVRRPSGGLNRPILNPDLFYEIPEKISSFFRLVESGVALAGHVIYFRDTTSSMDCSRVCARDSSCQSYNYYEDQGICELNNDTRPGTSASGMVPSKNVKYYEKLRPALIIPDERKCVLDP